MSDGSAIKYLFMAIGTTIAIGSAVVIVGNNNVVVLPHHNPSRNETAPARPSGADSRLMAPDTQNVLGSQGQSTILTEEDKRNSSPSPNSILITKPVITR